MRPEVLVFDVNETLLDIESLAPLFGRLLGDERALRQWFDQLVLHSMTLTAAGRYVDFGTLAQAVLRMVADIRGVALADEDVLQLRDGLAAMAPHPDVPDALMRLRKAGYRLATLTNSPPAPDGGPLARAGLAELFEVQVSVHDARAFKPAPLTYDLVAERVDADRASCMLVAAHAWDTIGAQCAGFSAALVRRPGNAPLTLPGVPVPDLVVADIGELADQLVRR